MAARQPATPEPSTPAAVRVPETAPRRFAIVGGPRRAALIGVGVVVVAVLVVLGARALEGAPAVQAYLRTYPGVASLPDSAPVGLPVWLNWQHFLNSFFLLLIVRSGLRIHSERRPDAYWTPRWSKDGAGKVSLTVWFHQSLDLLWVANGVVFIVLLFVTGQWLRIVPTSWDVVPNAGSALLRYVAFDWPLEDGWLHYNALQLLTYFVTTFVAAPLAVLTGVRMSSLWPKRAKRLSAAYPIEWARRLHYPVMLYFVAFVVVHVALVLATGAIANLDHMYASRDDGSFVGPLVFVGSVLVMVGAVLAARPTVLRVLASLSGRLSSR